ncbi:Copia protein [Termitomyces sp. J132]|nr:Copia protein [Termitomyces sp. J132]
MIRLLRYLKGTHNLKLTLGGNTSIVNLTGGYARSFGSRLVSWVAQKQKTVAASSCKAKYMAAFESTQECVWFKVLLKGIRHDITNRPTTILCNNNAAIKLSEDPTLHSHIKHINIKYHFLRECTQSNEISI